MIAKSTLDECCANVKSAGGHGIDLGIDLGAPLDGLPPLVVDASEEEGRQHCKQGEGRQASGAAGAIPAPSRRHGDPGCHILPLEAGPACSHP